MIDREQQEIEDRRKFLISAGRFAAVTPPAIMLLLSTSLTSDAIAGSNSKGHRGPKGNNGGGNGGYDGTPNGKDDTSGQCELAPKANPEEGGPSCCGRPWGRFRQMACNVCGHRGTEAELSLCGHGHGGLLRQLQN